jgi:hypothetical protein
MVDEIPPPSRALVSRTPSRGRAHADRAAQPCTAREGRSSTRWHTRVGGRAPVCTLIALADRADGSMRANAGAPGDNRLQRVVLQDNLRPRAMVPGVVDRGAAACAHEDAQGEREAAREDGGDLCAERQDRSLEHRGAGGLALWSRTAADAYMLHKSAPTSTRARMQTDTHKHKHTRAMRWRAPVCCGHTACSGVARRDRPIA